MKNAGLRIEQQDFIEVEQDYDTESFLEKLNDPSSQARVFTSQNAVRSLMELLEEHQAQLVQKKNFTVGIKTTEMLEQLGIPVQAKAGNAISLAQIIARNSEIRKLNFFCGNQSLDDLPEYLESKGIIVQKEIVYHTKLQSSNIDTTEIDALIFLSPTAVYSFFRRNKPPVELPCFCIGETTSAAVHLKCDNPRIIAAEPTAEALVERVIDYFGKN